MLVYICVHFVTLKTGGPELECFFLGRFIVASAATTASAAFMTVAFHTSCVLMKFSHTRIKIGRQITTFLRLIFRKKK